MKKLKEWVKNKFKKKQDISLVLAYEFSNGRKLYTYKEEDLGKVSSRYYRNLMEANNYLTTFALTKEQWTTAIIELQERFKNSLANGSKEELVQSILDANNTMSWFREKTENIKGANETILELMFCMFYLLEEEEPTGYNERLNEEKIALLNKDLEVRDFFLSSLKKNLTNYIPISDFDLKMQILTNKMTTNLLEL